MTHPALRVIALRSQALTLEPSLLHPSSTTTRTNLYIINGFGPPLSLFQCTEAECPFCGMGRRCMELARPWHKQDSTRVEYAASRPERSEFLQPQVRISLFSLLVLYARRFSVQTSHYFSSSSTLQTTSTLSQILDLTVLGV
ncbi:hypothetical protein P691DRAFT_517260 [Macrolepiota fuliginosa MF-IS2]|uniref:Uncharacterized protein n=1 Tax=Macrolepiota fuliginosa MF-IS2 TaxID=1400762 RepID=A0A9P6BWK7_9AGAR|nr:hypothetical protein P691DRAFT_517260 [Macrolepiota fuliginosa MF-IS2]